MKVIISYNELPAFTNFADLELDAKALISNEFPGMDVGCFVENPQVTPEGIVFDVISY